MLIVMKQSEHPMVTYYIILQHTWEENKPLEVSSSWIYHTTLICIELKRRNDKQYVCICIHHLYIYLYTRIIMEIRFGHIHTLEVLYMYV